MAKLTVIFDMDGLMVDTERISRRAWTRALADRGYQLEETAYLGMVGSTVPDGLAYLQGLFGADLPVDWVYQQRVAYYEQDIEENGIPLKPGLLELLAFLEQNAVVCAVATSTPCWFAAYKLGHAGLQDRFATIVCAEDVARGKPAPDLFLEAARRVGVPPQDCLVLEDSEAGIRAAHAAGMLPVMIPDLKQPSEEVRALAYCVFDDLTRVIPLLAELLRTGIPRGA